MTESPLTRLVRALLLAGLAVVLVGLVAVVASGHSIGGGGSSQPTPYAIDTILTILLGLFAIASVALLVGMFWVGLDKRRHPQRARAQARMRPSLLLTACLFAVLLFLFVRAGRDRDQTQPLQPPPSARSVQPPEDAASRRHDPQFQWVPFVTVFGAAAVAALAFFLAEKRRKRRLPPEPLTETLVEVLDETLADLRSEPDPRRAVIAAYARMERALAAHGVPRRRFEAPHEYLGRVLAELTGGGRGAKRLTALFERARFSTHAIDRTMQEEAIDAVEDLQAELVALEAERSARAA